MEQVRRLFGATLAGGLAYGVTKWAPVIASMVFADDRSTNHHWPRMDDMWKLGWDMLMMDIKTGIILMVVIGTPLHLYFHWRGWVQMKFYALGGVGMFIASTLLAIVKLRSDFFRFTGFGSIGSVTLAILPCLLGTLAFWAVARPDRLTAPGNSPQAGEHPSRTVSGRRSAQRSYARVAREIVLGTVAGVLACGAMGLLAAITFNLTSGIPPQHLGAMTHLYAIVTVTLASSAGLLLLVFIGIPLHLVLVHCGRVQLKFYALGGVGMSLALIHFWIYSTHFQLPRPGDREWTWLLVGALLCGPVALMSFWWILRPDRPVDEAAPSDDTK